MVQEKAERAYAKRVNASMTRVAEKTMFDSFQIGYTFENAGLKNTSYYSVESVLTEMARKRPLDKVFYRNIEQ